VVLPKHFSYALGIEKGDYLKVQMEGKRMILEKAEI
jgi:bifunctional DNA-binding transcriptional regulator/antitoxin component of YhaV-PrlF toxin-antitoxin module